MESNNKICVFGYNFKHSKTQNGIINLILSGFKPEYVILQNWKKLNVYTAKNIPRELSPLCDTTFNNASLIWFAKGPSKFNNQKYINALSYILKQKGNKK